MGVLLYCIWGTPDCIVVGTMGRSWREISKRWSVNGVMLLLVVDVDDVYSISSQWLYEQQRYIEGANIYGSWTGVCLPWLIYHLIIISLVMIHVYDTESFLRCLFSVLKIHAWSIFEKFSLKLIFFNLVYQILCGTLLIFCWWPIRNTLCPPKLC